MLVVATLLVRDEEDIVAKNIEHHIQQGISHFIVTDNRSKDNTPDIVKSFKEVVEFIEEPDEAYNQYRWVTRMARKACDLNPDWIVHLDADEFWQGFDILQKVPPEFNVITSTSVDGRSYRGFPPVSGEEFEEFDVDNYRYYEKHQYSNTNSKKVIHRPNRKIWIEQGNHGVSDIETNEAITTSISINHYPIRSYDQFEKKIMNGLEAYSKTVFGTESGPPIAWHWKRWHDIYLSGNLKEEYDKLTIDRENIPNLLKTGDLFDYQNVNKKFHNYNSWDKMHL